eukprot:TRINITY_DN10603_c0_g1_i1.p1 TRINITY_DN10603_c0_g1~~TRINITY_DN10603_c0_g1_i1.p1  ORF type:complete len:950 (+),score=177.53 TRINITY_DN10603_c0_g1_i1:62-2911(+)
MGDACSKPSDKSNTKGKQGWTKTHPASKMQQKYFCCPNAWCHKRVLIADYKGHRDECDLLRKSMCLKCGEVLHIGVYEQHLQQCNPVECSHCHEVVIKRLLPYCPQLQCEKLKESRSPARRNIPLTPKLAAIRIEKFYTGMAITRKWYGIIFRLIWSKMDKWDERGLFKSAETGAAHAPVKRLSVLLTNLPKGEQDSNHFFQYPEKGLGSIPVDEREDHINELRELVSHQKVPIAYLKRLLKDAKKMLSLSPNMQVVTLSSDGMKCIIVGDLHGQLQDLFRILDDRGYPSKRLYYVFNGDFVDRGCNSSEVLALVLVLYMIYPEYVFINRGNHESFACTEHYGARSEISHKYSEAMYRLVLDVFEAMPLAALVNGEVFIVHGGLSRYDVTLEEIDQINRFREIPSFPNNRLEQIFMDLVWSDPCPHPHDPHSADWEHNTNRAAGCIFRLPLTKRFCEKNSVSLVIRAHNPPHTGYETLHEGLIATVFSASNYTGVDSNHGAIAVLGAPRGGGPLSVVYETWKIYEPLDASLIGPAVPPGSPIGLVSPTFGRPQMSRNIRKWRFAEEDVVRQLREKVNENLHMLMALFCEVDTTKKGTIWKSEWVEVMSALFYVDLPWYFLRRFMTDVEPVTHRIKFAAFLKQHTNRVHDQLFEGWKPQLLGWIQAQTYENISKVFDKADVHKRGFIGYTAFFELITNTLQTLLEKELVISLYMSFDPDNTGYCSKEEWVRQFNEAKPYGNIVNVQNWSDCAWTPDYRQHIVWENWLLKRLKKFVRRLTPQSAFKVFDSTRKGHIEKCDLERAVSKMSLGGLATDVQKRLMMKDFKKRVTYKIGEKETNATVAALFGVTEKYIKENTVRGRVTVSIWPPTDTQLDKFFRTLDQDEDGIVSYQDFINSFYVKKYYFTEKHEQSETTDDASSALTYHFGQNEPPKFPAAGEDFPSPGDFPSN